MKRELLLNRPPYYESNPYALYVGADFPLVTHRNQMSSVKARVLLFKDSYGLPMQAFFSTLFSEVDVLDLRYFDEMTAVEYIEGTRPDMVVVLYNPSSLCNPPCTNFGSSRVPSQNVKAKWDCVQPSHSVRIAKSSDQYHYVNLTSKIKLRNGYVYRLTLGEAKQLSDAGIGVTVCLHDVNSRKFGPIRIVDLDYIRENKDCFSFKVPVKGEWRLLLYAGRRTSKNVAFEIGDVALYEKQKP